MHDINRNLNKTAANLAYGALKSMSLEANFGEYVWSSEVGKLTLSSTCSPQDPSNLDVTRNLFQCDVRAVQLCYTHLEWDEM